MSGLLFSVCWFSQMAHLIRMAGRETCHSNFTHFPSPVPDFQIQVLSHFRCNSSTAIWRKREGQHVSLSGCSLMTTSTAPWGETSNVLSWNRTATRASREQRKLILNLRCVSSEWEACVHQTRHELHATPFNEWYLFTFDRFSPYLTVNTSLLSHDWYRWRWKQPHAKKTHKVSEVIPAVAFISTGKRETLGCFLVGQVDTSVTNASFSLAWRHLQSQIFQLPLWLGTVVRTV
jgi:hypothetical protein